MNRFPTSRALACLLGIVSLGCGGRGDRADPQVGQRPPEASPTPAPVFDTEGSEGRGGIRSGDLPLGETPVDYSRYREPASTSGEDPTLDDPSLDPMGGGDASVLRDVFFEFDSYGLSAATRQVLTGIGAWMLANPRAMLVIEGHCDSRGTAAYNLVLGEKRALAVREFLAAMRIAPDRLATVSFGEERPAVPGRGEEVWKQNRRAHFRVASGTAPGGT